MDFDFIRFTRPPARARPRPPARRAGRPTSSLASSGPGNNLMGKMMELLLSKSCGVAVERMVVSLPLSFLYYRVPISWTHLPNAFERSFNTLVYASRKPIAKLDLIKYAE